MPRFIALLRGINVGGHRVKMDRLRALFGELGFDEISTFIASGNVFFTTPDVDAAGLEQRIESHLEEHLGFPVATLLRTIPEIEAVASFAESAESVYVIFLRGPVDDTLRGNLAALQSDTDRFRFGERVAYWLLTGKISESPLFGKRIGKALGATSHTTRNMTTVRKLLTK
jgi:uncharacterized protein (DUF1697 family)